MAKTIKFNLKLDNRAVRDIKGLQENFCIEDMLEVYENGLLEKWLEVRKFNSYLTKVKKIDENDSVIMQLIKIFSITQDENKIREAIYALEFEENQKQELKKFQESKDDLKRVVSDYHKNYEKLIKSILEKKENMAFLKEASQEISDKYLKLFELDYKELYELLKEKAPLMVFAILMNGKLAFWFMKNTEIKKDLYSNFLLNTELNITKFISNVFDIGVEIIKCFKCKGKGTVGGTVVICPICLGKGEGNQKNQNYDSSKLEEIKNNIGLYDFKGSTDSYWKDVETKGTKVMILSIPNRTFITIPNNLQKEYSSGEINGNFLIMDGLLYKSNNSYEPIVYMKV